MTEPSPTAATVVPLHPAARAPAQTERALAKVNLYLHLRGLREDGYHLLESLVVFPGLGDVLEVEDGPGLGLTLDGPFAWDLPADGDNLVLQAAERLAAAAGIARPRAALRLQKNLPVASGIGGGSADAAAALRLLSRSWGVEVPEALALALGADVPVCLACAPRLMEGIGERLSPAPALPPLWIVLVNPLVQVETRAVFRETTEKEGAAMAPPPPDGFADPGSALAWLATGRNDLEPAARRLCPPVARVLDALSDAPLARMSGSGATCFALYPEREAAMAKAAELRDGEPGWWTAAAPVMAA
ncbi:MAG: 4-(cytidine 5'-diphospho)-2-C-methyl-D-erythritol kinase [Pseudomonadota bacterium]